MKFGDKVRVVRSGTWKYEAGVGAEGVVFSTDGTYDKSFIRPIAVRLTKLAPGAWGVLTDNDVFDYDADQLEVIADEPLPFDDDTPTEVDAPAEDTTLLDELDALSE